jgi:FMN-dependent NADH-azoreductase
LTSLQFFPLQATAFLDGGRLTADQDALLTTMDTTRIDARVTGDSG